MLEFLIYSMTILVILNSVAIAVTVWVGFKSGQVDEAKRQYWQQRLINLKANGESVTGVEDIK